MNSVTPVTHLKSSRETTSQFSQLATNKEKGSALPCVPLNRHTSSCPKKIFAEMLQVFQNNGFKK